jgi:hypothetical protein
MTGDAADSVYARRPVTKAPHWGGLVAWDMLLNSLATGLFLAAALGELGAPRVFTAVATAAYPLALGLLLVDLLLLVVDLGDPWRFHHMLRVFKPSSPMSLGVWSLTAFSLPLTVLALAVLVPRAWADLTWLRLTAIILGLLPALASAVYKGVLLSTSAQPGWKDARWLGACLTTSAPLLGGAVLLMLAVLTGQDRAAAVLRPTLAALLVLHLIPLGLLTAELRPALVRRYPPGRLRGVGALGLGCGVVLALGLLLAGDWPGLALAAALLLVLGGLFIRYVIIQVPHGAS